jgi:hypothetical protein
LDFPQAVTNKGRICRIYTLDSGDTHPIHGAYRSGERWIPISWAEDGYLISKNQQSDLDISLWLEKYKQGQYEEEQQQAEEAEEIQADTFGKAF